MVSKVFVSSLIKNCRIYIEATVFFTEIIILEI